MSDPRDVYCVGGCRVWMRDIDGTMVADLVSFTRCRSRPGGSPCQRPQRYSSTSALPEAKPAAQALPDPRNTSAPWQPPIVEKLP